MVLLFRRWAVVGCVLIGSVLLTLIGGTPSAWAQPPDAERLFVEIAQRKDKARRQRGLDELLGRLKAPQATPDAQVGNLRLLQRVSEIPFDRAPFLPIVQAALGSPAPEVRIAALDVMPVAGASEADLPAIAQLADDPDPLVRAEVVAALLFSAGDRYKAVTRGEGVIFPIVEKLLADPDAKVKAETLHALWGFPISPKAEEQVIAFSKTWVSDRGPEGYDAIYYALSTRPVVNVPVARRLIEIMQDPKTNSNLRWRAAWGLGHKASPEAVDMMVRALIEELDETLEQYVRNLAVEGLATHRTPTALAKLREVAEKDESEAIRKAAANALK